MPFHRTLALAKDTLQTCKTETKTKPFYDRVWTQTKARLLSTELTKYPLSWLTGKAVTSFQPQLWLLLMSPLSREESLKCPSTVIPFFSPTLTHFLAISQSKQIPVPPDYLIEPHIPEPVLPYVLTETPLECPHDVCFPRIKWTTKSNLFSYKDVSSDC